MNGGVPAAETGSSHPFPAGVRVEGLTFAYPGGPEVLKDINLGIRAGERFGIIGPSGAGKSTLLLHLNGLLRPGSGRVLIDENLVENATRAIIRQTVGLVFQDPDDQLFTPTVGEDVAFGLRNQGLAEEEVAHRVDQTLEALQLGGFQQRLVHTLSYGERRRAALATVLVMQPRVVALDEPFSNLNPALIERLIGLLRTLPATLIVVSQAMLPVLALCDRLAVCCGGRIVATGSARQIVSDRALLRSCGLDFSFYIDTLRRLGL